MNWRSGLGLCLLVLTAHGCAAAGRASLPPESTPAMAPAGGDEAPSKGEQVALAEPHTTVLESVQVADAPGPENTVKVEVKATDSINYTSYEPTSNSFILEIPNVQLGSLPAELTIGRAGIDKAKISAVPAHDGKSHARIEFMGRGKIDAKIVPQGQVLAVLLKGEDTPRLIGNITPEQAAPVETPEPVAAQAPETLEKTMPAAEREPLPAATMVSGVVVEKSGAGASIEVIADGTMEHSAFVLTKPDRLVVDIDGVINGVSEKSLDVTSQVLHRVRIAQFRIKPEKVVRVVFDLSAPTDYEISDDGDTLRVFLGPEAEAARREKQGRQPASPAVADLNLASPPVAGGSAEAAPVAVPTVDEPATSSVPAAVSDQSGEVNAPETSSPAGQPAAAMDDVAARPAPAAQAQLTPASTVEDLPEPAKKLVPSSPLDLGNNLVLFDRADPKENSEEGSGQLIPPGTTFQSRTIAGERPHYRGEKISVTFRDADIREVFFFFADVMKMNVVLDPDVQGKIDIKLTQVPWDQAFHVILKNQGLDAVEEDRVIRIAKVQKLRSEASERRALKLARDNEVDPITFTRKLSYAKVTDAMRVLQETKSPRGKIIGDKRTNTLIIRDIPSRRPEYENLINALDTQTPQVSIEARIVEAVRSFERSLGIDWGFSASADPNIGTGTNLTFPHRATINADVNLASQSHAGTLGIALGNVLDSVTLDVTLDAFEAEGKVRILSAPKVVTQNNQAAQIEQGVQIPVVTTTATEINVQYVPASLRLIVTPQITAEQTVIMKVQVENNQPSSTITVGGTPGIVTERVETQILVRSGTTAVIGGVYKLQETNNEAGLPGLRRIPFFGWLFKNKDIKKDSSELLVFLTPRIVSNI